MQKIARCSKMTLGTQKLHRNKIIAHETSLKSRHTSFPSNGFIKKVIEVCISEYVTFIQKITYNSKTTLGTQNCAEIKL